MQTSTTLPPQFITETLQQHDGPMHIIDLLVAIRTNYPYVPMTLHQLEHLLKSNALVQQSNTGNTYFLRTPGVTVDTEHTLVLQYLQDELKAAPGPLHVSQVVARLSSRHINLMHILKCIDLNPAKFQTFEKGFIGLHGVNYPRYEMNKLDFFISGSQVLRWRLGPKPITVENIVAAMRGKLELSEEDAALWLELNRL